MTPDEIQSAARRMMRRLSRHLDALDSGDADAFDDLAGAIRTTLCFGRGDRLLLRLVNMFRLEEPRVFIPPTDTSEAAPHRIGPLPWLEDADGVGRSVPVSEWVETQAIRLPGVGKRTWNQVLIDFGNTYGAHVSATVPQLLDDIRAYGVAGGSMASHMLRCAGSVAEYGLGVALAELDGTEPPRPRDRHSGGVSIGFMALDDREEASFMVSCTATDTVEVFSMPVFEGRRMTGVWTYNEDTGTGNMHLDWSTFDQRDGGARTRVAD